MKIEGRTNRDEEMNLFALWYEANGNKKTIKERKAAAKGDKL